MPPDEEISMEAMIARIDERTRNMASQLEQTTTWQATNAPQIAVLVNANLPQRVGCLENMKAAIYTLAAGFVVLVGWLINAGILP